MNKALLDKAIDSAVAIRAHAYAPYSKFEVGAALVDSEGGLHVGCNVENASYGLTQCAERAAVTSAVASGMKSFQACVIVTDTEEPTMPCGACRQVLAEFGLDIEVISRTLSGVEKRKTLADLLPDAFTPVSLSN